MNFVDFPLGPFIISTGGLVFLLGGILATWMLVRTVHEKGLSLSFLNNHLLIFAGSAFVVGRLGAMGKFWSYFESSVFGESFPERAFLFLQKFIVFWQGGLDTFWTALGFLTAFLVLAFRSKENVWKWLDAFVLPTILLLIFWNLGAFFSAWDYGRPASEGFWFGVTYDVQGVRYAVPLHPVQMYAFLYYSVLFVVGFKWWPRYFGKKDGTFFGFLGLLVFGGNALLEFFRGDPAPTVGLGFLDLRLPQLISFILMLAFACFLVFHTHPEILQQNSKRQTPPQ